MELLNLLSNIRAIRIERKTLEDLINDLIEREKPSNYPNTTISEERVQSNHTQKTAENVYFEMQNLINELAIQKDNLLAVEVEATRRVYKEITDPLERAFIIKRFIQNKPVREIIRDFAMPKSSFYNLFKKYFSPLDKKDKIDKKNSSRCDIM